MSWLLLLLIFWKPILWTGMYAYHTFKKETVDSAAYWGNVATWFKNLASLILPGV